MKTLTVNLALQGGGAHGAFTWGVLDRLLEEEWLEFEGISGTSAGAMNAVLLADGWRSGGRCGARAKLGQFWLAVSGSKHGFELPGKIHQPMARWLMHTTQYVSPYDVGMLDSNPLRKIVDEYISFAALRKNSPFKLYIAATEVSSGKLRIFNEQELTSDHLLASACLPSIHRAIELDGKHYWDGGFSANPAVSPLVYDCDSHDILLVLLQPLERGKLPMTADSIAERVADMGFQNTFMAEMREIVRQKSQAHRRRFFPARAERQLKKMRLHLLKNEELFSELGRLTKYDNRQSFLLSLKEAGRIRAAQWLAQHGPKIGRAASCDIQQLFG